MHSASLHLLVGAFNLFTFKVIIDIYVPLTIFLIVWGWFCRSFSSLVFLDHLSPFNMSFYILHRHRVYVVDPVDLICNLYTWWEGFGSSFLATLPLGFNCGFISNSACRSSTKVCSWGCPGGLRSTPVRARCGGGAPAWVAGVLAAPGTQGSWWQGQQEI